MNIGPPVVVPTYFAGSQLAVLVGISGYGGLRT